MNIKKKLALLSATGLVGIGLTISGATYALFTDSDTNTGNSFAAGTVDIAVDRNHGDYIPGPMFYPNSLDPDGDHPYDNSEVNPSGEATGGWAPGDTVTRTMKLTNKGSLKVQVTGIKAIPRSSYTQTLFDGVSSRTINGETTGAAFEEFIEKTNVKVTNGTTVIYNGTLKSLINSDFVGLLSDPVINGKRVGQDPSWVGLNFEVTLNKNAGNNLQDKNFIFDFAFTAEQFKNLHD